MLFVWSYCSSYHQVTHFLFFFPPRFSLLKSPSMWWWSSDSSLGAVHAPPALYSMWTRRIQFVGTIHGETTIWGLEICPCTVHNTRGVNMAPRSCRSAGNVADVLDSSVYIWGYIWHNPDWKCRQTATGYRCHVAVQQKFVVHFWVMVLNEASSRYWCDGAVVGVWRAGGGWIGSILHSYTSPS